MGYDIKRFLVPVNEGLFCGICRGVLEDPVQAPCEHAFCRVCIYEWLLTEHTCPEDRQVLLLHDLKPLFRYMKNDLNKLKIKCRNSLKGCNYSCNLEFISAHTRECKFEIMTCPNMECSDSILKMDLHDHLKECRDKSKMCAKGCGIAVSNMDDREHNCIQELRSAIEILRSEMVLQIENQKKEMENRLAIQREYMVKRESAMQAEITDLRNEISRISQKLKLLLDLEERRKADFDKMENERKELFEMLKNLQRQQRALNNCPNCQPTNNGKVTTI
ncbi:hypothetical protein LOTGIDRAFT_211441 [Lottia gigantea]|uniref:RING-type domain-containing protein n=1 Tax=Lottia gigantea TaxID=225164 RepID=V3ZK70_LOTGI|nr:hypothetical protein LOTGIDRAFT_211441 [Lottia gigantea]ESO82790.1 hypothetical protein LOTGIDRAFT_211441 [Lottia gigantea]